MEWIIEWDPSGIGPNTAKKHDWRGMALIKINKLISWDPPGFGSNRDITHDGPTYPKIVFDFRIGRAVVRYRIIALAA